MIMYMGKASVTDTTLLFFMTGALLCFMHEKYWLMYLFCGFAVMTKGPIGVVFPGAIVFLYLLVTRDLGRMLRMHVIPGLILVAAVGMPWYVFMYQNHGMEAVFPRRCIPTGSTGGFICRSLSWACSPGPACC